MNQKSQIAVTDKSEKVLTEQVTAGEIDSFLTLSLDEQKTIHGKLLVDEYDGLFIAINDSGCTSVDPNRNESGANCHYRQNKSKHYLHRFNLNNIMSRLSAKSEEELNQARGLVYVLMFVIYFAVILYSSMIATEVATEKSSRVMEILISSVSPVKHMFAKVLGIGSLGLTQIVVYGIAGFIAFKTSATEVWWTDFRIFQHLRYQPLRQLFMQSFSSYWVISYMRHSQHYSDR